VQKLKADKLAYKSESSDDIHRLIHKQKQDLK